MPYHQPVLLPEVVALLRPVPRGRYVDGTLGGGGHAAAILDASSPDGELLGIDRDDEAVAAARRRLKKFGRRVRLVRANFAELAALTSKSGWLTVNGVLFDLGVSSHQLDRADRGFSFRKEGPLDMRMDRRQALTAARLLNEVSEEEVRNILETFGHERRARIVARAIVRVRARQKFVTTTDLAEIISRVGMGQRGFSDAAARIFQAIRIAVNNELDNLERGLAAAVERLASGGRLAVISFHSGEDAIGKHTFRRLSGQCVCPPNFPECRCNPSRILRALTPRAIVPSPAEVTANPRAASAKLRVAEKL